MAGPKSLDWLAPRSEQSIIVLLSYHAMYGISKIVPGYDHRPEKS